ncbi:hypothetical protein GE09DRAFT_117039 [Coniochaeta sp. 2T2.1]|nr:hypothetical protein GE09DRAFT_117039 [Coniochaeta sp. 2T2.1]
MDTARGNDGGGQPGIELSSNYNGNRYSQPGLEPVNYSNLEVVAPGTGQSHTGTWEKGSSLPQVAPPYGRHPALSPGAASSAVGTPYSSAMSPSYEYMSPSGSGSSPPMKDGFFGQDMICGVKRQTFWIVMAIGIFVMVAAVAIGVGLGVALHKSDDPSSTPLPSANGSSPTTTLPKPTATGVLGPEVVIRCPANNQTLYTPVGTNRSYLLLCGRDYSSIDGAVDLFNEPMDSMSDCIQECGKQEGCVGVGYGPYNNQNTCWLKSKLGTPNVTPNWYFAVEDDGALGGK